MFPVVLHKGANFFILWWALCSCMGGVCFANVGSASKTNLEVTFYGVGVRCFLGLASRFVLLEV